jgi:DNA-directed RNA polymerase specialized sigma24 family protein
MMSVQSESVDHEDLLFERRMDNWRRTVLYLGKGVGTCGPAWAAMYYRLRDAETEVVRGVGAVASLIPLDEKDGWEVERAWNALTDDDDKVVLKLWYVSQRTPDRIRCLMGLRRMRVTDLLERAKKNLQKNLAVPK